MRNTALALSATVLLIAGMNACAPGAGGLSGGSPVEGTSEPGTNEDAGTPQGPGGNLPAGGIAYGVDGAQGTGVDDGTGAPRLGGSLPGGGIAYGVGGAQGTGVDDGTGAPRLGGLPGPGAPSDTTIARGTDVGNPEDAEIPLKDWGLCLEHHGFLLLSRLVMRAEPLQTIEDDVDPYRLSATSVDEREATVDATFYSSSFSFKELLTPPRKRLERWVRAKGLDLDFITGPLPTMAGEQDGEMIVAATLYDRRHYALLRGDPALVEEIQVTTTELYSELIDRKDFSCSDILQPGSPHDITIIKGLIDRDRSRTLRMLAPPKK